MTELKHEKTTLIVGGTGKTGRRVAQRLTARGLPVRVGSRSGEPPFDWTDRATWAPALRGTDAAYVTYYPDLAVPGAADTIGAFADLAVDRGVRRLILLSGRGEAEAQRAEQRVQESEADWTILRSSWFSQNFSESFFLESVLSGEIAVPAGNVREPFTDANDIADAAVAALTEDGHTGQLYELTGPRLLTFAEA
ncbi:MAG: SDR family oxidoreductase, partial [Jiangellaceae bacterium]